MDRRAANSRGIGIFLILVVVILLVLLVMGLAQGFFSSQVTDEAHRAYVGRRCIAIAESAVEEAFHRIQREVNQPGSRLFARFRRVVLAGQPGDFAISLPRFRATQALVNDLEGYDFGQIKAEAVFQRQTNFVEYERLGLLRLTAAGTSDAYSTSFRRFTRRIEVFRDFRVVKVTPPRPFDRMTLVVRNCQNLVGPGNDEIRACYRSMRGDLGRGRTLVQDLRSLIRGYERLSSSPFAPNYKGVVKILREHIVHESRAVQDSDMGNLAISDADLEKGYPREPHGPHLFGMDKHYYVKGTEDLAIAVDTDSIDLPQLFIAPRVIALEETRLSRVESRNRTLDDMAKMAERAQKRKRPPATSVVMAITIRLLQARKAELRAAKEILRLYRNFQVKTGELTTLEKGGTLHRWESTFFGPKLSKKYWWNNCTYHVRGQEQLTRLLKSVSPLSGVVWVKGDLELNGTTSLQGKIIIVVDGRLRVDGYKSADPTLDSLTLIAYGDASLAGRIDASIILASQHRGTPIRLTTEPGMHITGNLVVSGRLVPSVAPPAPWAGKVTRNKHQNGGKYTARNGSTVPENPNHFCVILSPQIRAKGVYRQ